MKPRAARPRSQAERADRHRLYERSVQNAATELEFVRDTYRQLRGRYPLSLREDFCGTALVSSTWVRERRSHTAVGVDFDAEVLDYGRAHHLAGMTPGQRGRISLVHADVLEVETAPVDVLLAMNFSYWHMTERSRMRRYFERVRAALKPGGVFFLDAYGGYDAFRCLRERTEHRGFTYIWHQADYDPITGHYECHIDFSFPDGSKLTKAFSYTWRLWTLPEIRETLSDAGFARVTVYWEGTDERTGEGNGVFAAAARGTPDAGWIAYLTAEP